ncbi:MAG TPA: transposase [Nevskia sp.]|nr:transposase [Nevskia sp.]
MVLYRRNRVQGGTYFLTVTLRDRSASFLVDHAEALRESFRSVRTHLPFIIDALVIMPDHLHLLCTLPEGDDAYSERIRLLKRNFTAALSGQIELPGKGLWQPRFWEHTVRDEADFQRHFDYIHFNPVKHGYVNRVADWPYSSFHKHVKNGLLAADWGGDFAEIVDGGYGER